jgi:hypothetical protein
VNAAALQFDGEQDVNKDTVLFPDRVDRDLLVPIDPACERCEDDPPGPKHLGHGPILGSFGPR